MIYTPAEYYSATTNACNDPLISGPLPSNSDHHMSYLMLQELRPENYFNAFTLYYITHKMKMVYYWKILGKDLNWKPGSIRYKHWSRRFWSNGDHKIPRVTRAPARWLLIKQLGFYKLTQSPLRKVIHVFVDSRISYQYNCIYTRQEVRIDQQVLLKKNYSSKLLPAWGWRNVARLSWQIVAHKN